MIASVAGRLKQIAAESPLRTLLQAVAAELAQFQKALDRLYQSAFIETDESTDDRTDGTDRSEHGDDGRARLRR